MTYSWDFDIQPFSNPASFKEFKTEWDKWGTFELGRYILDGTMVPFPTDMASRKNWGLWSQELSDDNGDFKTPKRVFASFTKDHATVGFTFHFDEPAGEWAKRVDIIAYNSTGAVVGATTVYPNSANYYARLRVDRFRRVEFVFYGTNIPRRYLKLANIDYGKLIVLSGDSLLSGTLLERSSQTSREMLISTCTFRGFVEDEAANILDTQSLTYGFRARQKVDIHLVKDGQVKHRAGHYLESVTADSERRLDFSSFDAIGVLDVSPFEGNIYNTNVKGILPEILEGFEYEVDPSLENLDIKGWIPVCTKREALQQLAFAANMVVDTSSGRSIQLYPRKTKAYYTIGYGRKIGSGSAVSPRETPTELALVSHSYTKGGESWQPYRDTPGSGVHEINISEPSYDYSITGGTIVSQGPNRITIQAGNGEVTISATKYKDNTARHSSYHPGLSADAEDKVMVIEDATLVSPARAQDIADTAMEYMIAPFEQKIKVIRQEDEERLGDTTEVRSFSGLSVRGNIEEIKLGLTNGLNPEIIVVGNVVRNDWRYHTTELIAGGSGILL